MTIVFNAVSDPAAKIALYDGGDDLPLATPLSYLSRVHFHSDLLYLPIVATLDATLNVAGTVSGLLASHTVGAHGQAGYPLVFGYALGVGAGGLDLPLCGSVPVIRSGSLGEGILWTLQVNATNVLIHEARPYHTFTPVSISVRIYVTNFLLE